MVRKYFGMKKLNKNIFEASPTHLVTFHNRQIYIKRDDLLHKDFSGNKARKFYYYLLNDFPHVKKVISRGSNQSNAMYSLSVLAKMKNWEFEYYVDHIPSFLQQNPQGNYKYALENGMKIYQQEFSRPLLEDEIFIQEGGAVQEAQYGIKLLAQEIILWAKEQQFNELNVFLPSGTGTTALYLQKFLPFPVFTCPCVGDEVYLKKQFEMLEDNNHPTILKTPKKFHFGKLYKENFHIWNELKNQTNIEFDLLYDPIGWQTLLDNILYSQSTPLLYIHQGGIKGNVTMLNRYCRKM